MGKRRDDITKELLEELYWGEGKSTREIAKLLGCSQPVILERIGIGHKVSWPVPNKESRGAQERPRTI